MSEILTLLVEYVAQIHDKILTLNDSYEWMLSDKQLHFVVMGLIGMAILLLVYPLFQILHNHLIVVAWIYTFTVMVVLTFAIEIGQKITGTGQMEFDDIISGLAGFMAMFLIFAAIRGVFLLIVWLFRRDH
ncbi:MAG: hypothetical protein Q4F79_01385 [Eubacteriales bacterium]|nr:hypothetical protein [Eubacteriales bacterium]